MVERKEKILVLYGSLKGAAERVARNVAKQLPEEIANAEAVVMTLDDFLLECQWTRLVVIVTSSFGMGGAPMNAKRFRRLCDAWIETYSNEDGAAVELKALDGLSFALCGLGDSMYKTYQKNPETVKEALIKAGAELIGIQGVVDAGANDSENEIKTWMDALWPALKDAIDREPVQEDSLHEMHSRTKDALASS